MFLLPLLLLLLDPQTVNYQLVPPTHTHTYTEIDAVQSLHAAAAAAAAAAPVVYNKHPAEEKVYSVDNGLDGRWQGTDGFGCCSVLYSAVYSVSLSPIFAFYSFPVVCVCALTHSFIVSYY